MPFQLKFGIALSGVPIWIVIYVTDNGNTMRHTGDPSTIELRSKRLITIQIGTPVNAIPNFSWNGT